MSIKTNIEVDGSDLLLTVTLRDSSDNDIIAGHTVTFSVRRLEVVSANDRYWNTGTNDWDLVSEPGVLDAAVQGVVPGTYELRLTGAYTAGKYRYSVHTVVTGGTESGDFHEPIKVFVNPDNTNIAVLKAVIADALSELPQAALPKNPTLAQAIMALYMPVRNGVWTGFDVGQSKNLTKIKNDAGVFITQQEYTDNATVFESEKSGAGL